MLQDRLGLSERRACRIAGQNRSTQRHCPRWPRGPGPAGAPAQDLRRAAPLGLPPRPRPPAHRRLVAEPQAGAADLARGGPARARQGQEAPAPGRVHRAARPAQGRASQPRLGARLTSTTRPTDGRELKFLNVVDEFTREALAIEVDRTINAEETVEVLERLAAKRGAPANIRSDNGPELTAAVLREWCRQRQDRHRLHRAGLALAERLRGVLQRPPARRAAERRGVHLPGRGPGAGRRLARRLQRQPPALGAWHDVARALRRLAPLAYGLASEAATAAILNTDQPRTLTRGGPMNGVRSPRLLPSLIYRFGIETVTVAPIRRRARRLRSKTSWEAPASSRAR